MNWFMRLFHRCWTPRRPVVEDQAQWTCPECGKKWEYARWVNDYETFEGWNPV